MNKSLSICITLFVISISLFAGPNPKGMIIRNTDTLYVTFVIPVTGPNYPNLQDSIRYLDSLNNECYLSPEDAKEYRFEHKGKLIRMVSIYLYPDAVEPTKIFLQLLIDGPLKLFKHYTRSSGGYSAGAPGGPSGSAPVMTSSQSNSYLLQMGDKEIFFYTNQYFKKDLPIVLNKCPALVKMIQENIYLKKDIEEIVNYYNTKCGSN